MFSSQKEFLDIFGWDGFFESQCSDHVSRSMFPMNNDIKLKGGVLC